MIKKMLEILELLKCDTETGSEQMHLGKMAPIDLLDEVVPQTFNLEEKKDDNYKEQKSTMKEGLCVFPSAFFFF